MRNLARICYQQRRIVLVGWIVLLVGLLVLSQTVGGESKTEFTLPGSESQQAFDLLEAHGFANRAGEQAQIVFEAEQGIDDPAVREAMEGLFAAVEQVVADADVSSPYAPGGERQISPDGTIAYAEVNLADRSQEAYLSVGEQIREQAEGLDVSGLRIEFGGTMFIEQAGFSSELIGILCAMVILLIAFGSLLAMGLPILTALFGIGSGIALIGLVANVLSVPSFASPAAAMIGIGVGIDYALFIVTRYRQGLHDGMEPEPAIIRALDTAGRAVIFAGITVVISLMGMFLTNLDAMIGLAVSASLAVLMTMLAAVTLLPAILGFAGHKIDKFGLPHRRQAEGDARQSIWYRWSRVIQRRPWVAAISATVVLLILIVPVFSLRLGFGDAGNRAETDTTRQAFDLLSRGFGPGSNGPLLLASELPNGTQDLPTLEALVATLNQTDGIAFASPPIPNEAGDTAIIQVIPTTAPQDEATSDLVMHLRDTVIPPINDASGLDVLVGGAPAAVIDFSDYTAEVLPLFIGAVLILSFLLLMAVFRSVVVPLKAVLVNLLSIGAAMA